MRASRRWAWRLSGAASIFTGTVMGYDVAVHRWDWFPVMAACTAVNSGWARYHYRRAHQPEPPHRPDYAKIRRLELELGLRDPDPVPDPEPVVRVTRLAPSQQAAEDYVSAFRAAQEAYAKWEVCPVCTRRHAGRCAG